MAHVFSRQILLWLQLNQRDRRGGNKKLPLTHRYSSAKVEVQSQMCAAEEGEMGWRTEQANRHREVLCQDRGSAVEIINSKLIRNLSGPQHTRSAPLVGQTSLTVRDPDKFWVYVLMFWGLQLCERRLAELHTATQRASLPVGSVGGEFIALSVCSSKSLHFLCFSVSIIFSPLCATEGLLN